MTRLRQFGSLLVLHHGTNFWWGKLKIHKDRSVNSTKVCVSGGSDFRFYVWVVYFGRIWVFLVGFLRVFGSFHIHCGVSQQGFQMKSTQAFYHPHSPTHLPPQPPTTNTNPMLILTPSIPPALQPLPDYPDISDNEVRFSNATTTTSSPRSLPTLRHQHQSLLMSLYPKITPSPSTLPPEHMALGIVNNPPTSTTIFVPSPSTTMPFTHHITLYPTTPTTPHRPPHHDTSSNVTRKEVYLLGAAFQKLTISRCIRSRYSRRVGEMGTQETPGFQLVTR